MFKKQQNPYAGIFSDWIFEENSIYNSDRTIHLYTIGDRLQDGYSSKVFIKGLDKTESKLLFLEYKNELKKRSADILQSELKKQQK
jgi:hypothetical protein